MTATRQEIALDWVEQWRDFCAGKPAMVLKELDAPHGRVRIHGRRGDPHDYVATFVRNPDGMVVPLGTGDYSSCADACVGVLSGQDAVWDSDKFPPFSVIARRCRKFFSPVDGRTVVGALEIVGGVVLLGVHHKVWSLLFHDGQRSEWLRASSRTFDLDAWLRDRPGATVSAPPVRQPPAEPAPASEPAPATPPSPASPSAGPAPATPPSPASPSAEPVTPPSPASPSAGSAVPPSPAATPGAPAVSTPPSATASTPPAASSEPSTPAPAPVTPAERRRLALAAQRDAELREQQEEAARKDAALREQQRRVVLGPEPDPGEGPSDSDTVRACLMRLPDRAPTGQPQLVVEWFAKVVLAVGEAGYFGDLAGRKADIAATLSRVLGAPVCAKMLGLALTILHRMGTCLVALANKKWWTVRLSGLADRASSLHRDLLAETGIGFQLRPTRHAFRGRQPVRWEVPRHVVAGEVTRQDKPSPNTEEPASDPRSSSAAETPAPSPSSAPSGPGPVDAATGAEDADLRHRLTVAHGLAKLAHQRHDEDRAAWQREKAELEQRVAVAEKQAHAAGAELARVREQYHELQGKLSAIQENAERTNGLVDKLERATAALVASTEQQESLARSAEVLTAERDQLAAEVERLTRLADEQDRRVRGQTAEPAAEAAAAVTGEHDQLPAEVARLVHLDQRDHQSPDPAAEPQLAAAAAAAVAHEQLVPDAPRNADGVRRAGPPGLPPTALACVALTLAGLAFRSSRRKRRVVCRPPSRFPRAPRASSTSDGGAQGPRGPPQR